MAFHANLHNVKSMVPMCDPTGTHSWLDIKDDMGNEVGIFMPLAVAERIAAAFTVENILTPEEAKRLYDAVMTPNPLLADLDFIEVEPGRTDFDDIPAKPSDYTDANLSDFDDGNITP